MNYPNKILLVLTNQPLTRHTYKRLGVNTTYKGWKIIYWNFLPFVNRKLDNAYSGKGNRLRKDNNFIKIYSLSNLIEEYKKIPNRFFYNNLAGPFVSISLLDRILNFSGGTKIAMEHGREINAKIKFIKTLKQLIIKNKLFFIKKTLFFIWGKIKLFICKKILQVRPNIIFSVNFITYLYSKKKYKNEKIFRINSPEFNLFLESKNKKKSNSNTILFIDDVMEGSFDYKLGYLVNKTKTMDTYWDPVDKLCDFIKKKFPNNKLLIAAHHRRNEYDIPIRKKFIFDKTCQLIKNSKLILCHNSLACQLAVLFRKPIIFIDTDYIQSYRYYSHVMIASLSKALGSQIINISKNFKPNKKIFETIKSATINEKKYEKYEKNYISYPGLKSYGRWKTVLKYLERVEFNK